VYQNEMNLCEFFEQNFSRQRDSLHPEKIYRMIRTGFAQRDSLNYSHVREMMRIHLVHQDEVRI
jgi:hypothetical protein